MCMWLQARQALETIPHPGHLSGMPGFVPKYELRDPGTAAGGVAAGRASPTSSRAAGIPLLLADLTVEAEEGPGEQEEGEGEEEEGGEAAAGASAGARAARGAVELQANYLGLACAAVGGVPMRLARLLLEPVWQAVVWLRAGWLKRAPWAAAQRGGHASPDEAWRRHASWRCPGLAAGEPERPRWPQGACGRGLWGHRPVGPPPPRMPTCARVRCGRPGWSAWSAAPRSTWPNASARPPRR